MKCISCQSTNLSLFPAEINIHFPGLDGLDKSTVWAFPYLSVCLDCGLTQFTLSNPQLLRLREPGGFRAAEGTAAGAA